MFFSRWKQIIDVRQNTGASKTKDTDAQRGKTQHRQVGMVISARESREPSTALRDKRLT